MKPCIFLQNGKCFPNHTIPQKGIFLCNCLESFRSPESAYLLDAACPVTTDNINFFVVFC
jgi:hypothetical protein